MVLILNGRDDRIRTCDLIVPNDARYQTVLHPAIYIDILPKQLSCVKEIVLTVSLAVKFPCCEKEFCLSSTKYTLKELMVASDRKTLSISTRRF